MENKTILKQLVPFLILMQNGVGIATKSPEYILKKVKLAENYDQNYRLLDPPNCRKLLLWLKENNQEGIYTEDELDEIKMLAGWRGIQIYRAKVRPFKIIFIKKQT